MDVKTKIVMNVCGAVSDGVGCRLRHSGISHARATLFLVLQFLFDADARLLLPADLLRDHNYPLHPQSKKGRLRHTCA